VPLVVARVAREPSGSLIAGDRDRCPAPPRWEAAVNDTRRTDAGIYLQVMPRFEADARSQRWHVYQVSDESPRITLAGSVNSFKEAQSLAERDNRPLRIAEQAWQQMRAANVAPKTVPDDVTIT
jgi:hypothetical protein